MAEPEFDAQKILSGLSAAQRSELMHALLSGVDAWIPCTRRDLSRAEDWFWRQFLAASAPGYAHSRLRMWFIFMILRYGGLRLGEVFQLSGADLNFQAGILHAGSRRRRVVPLPLDASRRLDSAWLEWAAPLAETRPLQCDASQVRRALAHCAASLGIAPEMLNARALRRGRGLELAAEGLHSQLVDHFLGKRADFGIFPPGTGLELIKRHIQEKSSIKTSARNTFAGRVACLWEKGILVEVVLETAAGLRVAAVITSTSRKSLELDIGKKANAIVKAPWVSVFSENSRDSGAMQNCFHGIVKTVRRDELAYEIMVRLPQGNEICALYANGATPAEDIIPGAVVRASFSPFAVILMEA